MRLDLAVLVLLAVAAVAGAASGALRQLVSLAAVVLGALAARAWTDDVAAGLARTFRPAARLAAPLLLFLGVAALASLAGALVLRGTGLARIVRGPADRGAGALLGGAKGALAAWVLLSVLALAGPSAPDALERLARGSDLYALARAHNLVARLDPGAARALERALAAARRAERAGRLAQDPDSARLLADPRIQALEGRPLDEERSARALDDPEVRALVERLSRRAP
jgi:membrane protein required for colicin V production